MGALVVNKSTIANIAVTCFLIALPAGIWYIIGVNEFLSASLSETIFSTLIQVNATLIGFFGIVFVYNLRMYSERLNMLRNYAFQILEKKRLILNDIEETNDMKELTRLKRKLELVGDTLSQYKNWIREEIRQKSKFGNYGIVPIVSFLISITLSITALAKISEAGLEMWWLYFAIVPLFFGAFLLIVSMGSSVPSDDKSSQKEE